MNIAPSKIAIKTKQISRVSWALIRGEISWYPPFIEKFEKRYAKLVGKSYALTFCNGTSAIEAALFAANIGPGDEVIVPSCTFHASIDPIVNAGAIPVFADVDEKSLTINPMEVQQKISPKTKAVIAVHLWGIPANMGALTQILQGKNITLIEDVSHAHGARWGHKACGAWGDFGVFSLQGSKSVAAGEGGIVLTDRREDYLRMSMWGHFGRHSGSLADIGAEDFRFTGVGYKRRMAPLGALLADADLDFLDRLNRQKRRNASILDYELGDIEDIAIARPAPEAVRGGFYQGYPIQIQRPQRSLTTVLANLTAAGIQAQAYPFPLHHRLRVYTDPAWRQALLWRQPSHHPSPPPPSLPVTERLARQLILLSPNYFLHLNRKTLRSLVEVLENL